MKRLFLALTGAMAIQSPSLSEVNCDHADLSELNQDVCLEKEIKKSDLKNSDEYIELEFPFATQYIVARSTSGAFSDKRKQSYLESDDGTTIRIKAVRSHGGDQLEIPGRRVISWGYGYQGPPATQQEMNQSGANSMRAGLALGLASPLLQLPFMLRSGVTPFQNYQINYIDSYGKSQAIYAANLGASHQEVVSLLRHSTGLASEEVRNDKEVNNLLVNSYRKLFKLHLKYQNSITRANPKKPWCSTLDRSLSPVNARKADIVEAKMSDFSVDIRSLPEFATQRLEGSFDDYLKSNPNIKAWADANPAAAKKLRQCS